MKTNVAMAGCYCFFSKYWEKIVFYDVIGREKKHLVCSKK